MATDAVGSIRTVASFCAEEKIMQLYAKKCEGPMKTGVKQGLISGTGFGVSFFLLFAVYATCFYVGARFVENGIATFTDVFRVNHHYSINSLGNKQLNLVAQVSFFLWQVFFAITMAAMSITQSSSLTPDSSKAKSAAASVFQILDRKSEIDPSNDSGTILENVKGDIELRHVSFKYPSRPDVQIFRDLSLAIHSGKVQTLILKSSYPLH